MSETLHKEKQIQIQIDEAVARGTYVNFCAVSHKPGEFIVDFVFMYPLEPKGKVQSRIVMNPVAAKQIFTTLLENLRIYEERFGRVNAEPVDATPRLIQ